MIAVFKGSMQVIKGLNSSQKERIKNDLTFKNPAYEQALKYSKYSRVYAPMTLKYYKVSGSDLIVPVGYNIPFEVDSFRDGTLDVKVKYPSQKVSLRDTQTKAFKAFIDGCGTGTLILKTGEGKSILGLAIAGFYSQKTLVVVNKDDLIDGWQKDAKVLYGEDIEVGLVKGKVFKIGEQITLTTIQTLSKLGEAKLENLIENIGMVICDETHRVGAKSYQVLCRFPARYKLGLTATKMRNDGLVDVIDLLCGKTLFDSTNLESDGIIPPKNIHIIRKNSTIFWKPRNRYYYKRTFENVGELKVGEEVVKPHTILWNIAIRKLLEEGKVAELPLQLHEGNALIAEDLEFNDNVCRDIITCYTKGKSCVVFCRTVQHLEKLYDYLYERGYTKIQKFYGGMKETKGEIKERAERKDVLVTFATIAIATEGVNVKSWECGFLVDSVANEKDLVQIIGRLRRECDGKKDVFFFDYRHPNMVAFNKHGEKRDKWYKNLGITS